MPVIKYIRLPFQFDVQRLQEEVTALASQPWPMHYQKLHYSGNWSAIPLRSINGEADNVIISPHSDAEYKDTVFLQQSVYLKETLQHFNCPLLAVRLLKLDAGSVIKEHRDAELSFEHGQVRIHIPVFTNPEVEFILEGEEMQLQEGECWYMNFNLRHAIHNKSSRTRVHLVIDAVVNDWVKELFSQPGLLRKETESVQYDADTRRQIITQLRMMGTETANRIADEMEKEAAAT